MKYFYSITSLVLFAVILAFLVGCFNAYFYPMKYSVTIEKVAEEYQISASLIASVANAESGFKEDAVSSKGAVGIMQIMPDTAKWLAEKMDVDYSEDMLKDAEYNIQMGAFYISYLKQIFSNQKTVLCAYNAGIGNVRQWLKDEKYSADGQSLKEVPLKATKNYVNRVLKNNYYYKNKYK